MGAVSESNHNTFNWIISCNCAWVQGDSLKHIYRKRKEMDFNIKTRTRTKWIMITQAHRISTWTCINMWLDDDPTHRWGRRRTWGSRGSCHEGSWWRCETSSDSSCGNQQAETCSGTTKTQSVSFTLWKLWRVFYRPNIYLWLATLISCMYTPISGGTVPLATRVYVLLRFIHFIWLF